MKHHLIFCFLFFFILSGCVSGTTGLTPYRPHTVTTIKGNVNSIDTVLNKQTNEEGLHLKITNATGPFIIHVCPQWYADKKKIRFDKNELLIITGSTFTKDNEPNIYAATITDSTGHVLQLRNQNTGETMWTGRNRDESLPKLDKAKQMKTQQEMKERYQKSNTSFQKVNDGSQMGSQKGRDF